MVRLASIGFCCGELAEVQAKLFKMINSGDDDGCPTARHNEARMLICEEKLNVRVLMSDLGEVVHSLFRARRYLAARLVYHELRSESATPGAATNATTGSFLQEGGALLTLKDVVLSRQNSFLSLIEQTPTILLVSFVGELGIELTHAWLYVIVDYLRKQKLDQIYDYLESDQEALSRSIESMMQMTRKRVQTTALGGLTHEDCRNVEKRLEEVQRLSQCLIEEIHSRTVSNPNPGLHLQQTLGPNHSPTVKSCFPRGVPLRSCRTAQMVGVAKGLRSSCFNKRGKRQSGLAKGTKKSTKGTTKTVQLSVATCGTASAGSAASSGLHRTAQPAKTGPSEKDSAVSFRFGERNQPNACW
eukprot:g11986.t1